MSDREVLDKEFEPFKEKIRKIIKEEDGGSIESIVLLVSCSNSFYYMSEGTITSQVGAIEIAKNNLLEKMHSASSPEQIAMAMIEAFKRAKDVH